MLVQKGITVEFIILRYIHPHPPYPRFSSLPLSAERGERGRGERERERVRGRGSKRERASPHTRLS